MKNNVDSKLLLGLVIGAVVGAAIGYLAATDKKGQILDELNGFVEKVKEGFGSAVNKLRGGNAENLTEEASASE
ncbi:MAG: YtxH domain-containing protein [Tannerella sp.]|jgi:gas vesicle protein|nr:YtxH domain-containing protein [Tannerella sp.]